MNIDVRARNSAILKNSSKATAFFKKKNVCAEIFTLAFVGFRNQKRLSGTLTDVDLYPLQDPSRFGNLSRGSHTVLRRLERNVHRAVHFFFFKYAQKEKAQSF